MKQIWFKVQFHHLLSDLGQVLLNFLCSVFHTANRSFIPLEITLTYGSMIPEIYGLIGFAFCVSFSLTLPVISPEASICLRDI